MCLLIFIIKKYDHYFLSFSIRIRHNSTNRNHQNEISSSATSDLLKDCCNNKLIKLSDKPCKILIRKYKFIRKQKELFDVTLIVDKLK